jgi:RNA polymerase primary sigma factor
MCLIEETTLPDREVANRELLARARAGDDTAMNELLSSNRGLVRRALILSGLDRSPARDDLEQEGLVALYKAAQRWDPVHGVRFSTFAFAWLVGAVRSAAARTTQYGTVSPASLRDAQLVRWASDELMRSGVADPTTRQVAAVLGWDLDRVDEAKRCVRPLERLDNPHGDSVGSFASSAPGPLEEVEVRSARSDAVRMLDSLPERERTVIAMRFGIGSDRPASLYEVAQKLGVSVERVRHIESRALSILRRQARPSSADVG